MKILIDARCVRPGSTGIGVATRAAIHSLALACPQDQFHVLTLATFASPFDPVANVTVHLTRWDYEAHPWGECFEHGWLPRRAARLGVEIFWGPAHLIPWRRTRFAKVVTIHDLTVFDYPFEYPRRFAAYMRWVIQRSVAAADAVVCVSEATRQRLLQKWPTAASKTHVVHLGAADVFFAEDPPPRPPELPKPFILSVGGGQPRKNLRFGAEIVHLLRTRHGLDLDYVVVGRDPTLPSWVRQCPYLPQVSLRPYYAHAAMLLVPSLDEGFGLPVVEAMACGCPVAVANRGALPEIAGEAAACVFSLEEGSASVAEKLAVILSASERLEAAAAAGRRRAKTFRWHRAAENLRRVFELAHKGGPHGC